MRHLILIRKFHSYDYGKSYCNDVFYIIGSLYYLDTNLCSSLFVCDTLESEFKCVPSETYQGSVSFSPRFRRNLPIISTDFLHRSGIRFHSGNTVKDTEGCILVGENKEKGKVLNSRKSLDKLLSLLEGDDFILTIIDSKNIKS